MLAKKLKIGKISAGILAVILMVNVGSCSNKDGTEGFEGGSQWFVKLLEGDNYEAKPNKKEKESQAKTRKIDANNFADDNPEIPKNEIISEERKVADPSGAKAGAPVIGKPGDGKAGQPPLR